MASGLSPLDPIFLVCITVTLIVCGRSGKWRETSHLPFNVNYNGQFVDAMGNSINVTADGSF